MISSVDLVNSDLSELAKTIGSESANVEIISVKSSDLNLSISSNDVQVSPVSDLSKSSEPLKTLNVSISSDLSSSLVSGKSVELIVFMAVEMINSSYLSVVLSGPNISQSNSSQVLCMSQSTKSLQSSQVSESIQPDLSCSSQVSVPSISLNTSQILESSDLSQVR